MAKPVRVTIEGPTDPRAEAPTVDDLIGQIRDFVELLEGVDEAVEGEGRGLVWRVTDASKNSPLSFELTPTGGGPAAVVAARVDRVERIAADGLMALRSGNPRPPYFTDKIIAKARKMHARTLNGLSSTHIAFEPDIEAEPIVIDRPSARELDRTMARAIAVQSIPYRELGSVEGFVAKPELDGFGRAILRFRSRLDGSEIKAYADGQAFHQLEEMRVGDVWHGVRVRVYGTIDYRTLGQVDCIHATSIEVMDRIELPGIDDIVDPSFTGGLTTEEFLRELRRDD